MENFVFPDEIKTKLMKMSKLKNIFTFPKIMGKCSKLHFFSWKTSLKCATISFTKCVSNYSKLVWPRTGSFKKVGI